MTKGRYVLLAVVLALAGCAKVVNSPTVRGTDSGLVEYETPHAWCYQADTFQQSPIACVPKEKP